MVAMCIMRDEDDAKYARKSRAWATPLSGIMTSAHICENAPYAESSSISYSDGHILWSSWGNNLIEKNFYEVSSKRRHISHMIISTILRSVEDGNL